MLLAEIARLAGETRGWPRLRAEVTPRASLVEHLALRAVETSALFPDDEHGPQLRVRDARLRAGVGGFGAELRLERPTASPLDPAVRLEAALGHLAALASARGSGVVITIDEAHLAPLDDLTTVAAALQVGTEQAWPFVIVLAGLPTIREPSHIVSYLERSEWHEIDTLDEASTLAALELPAARAGRPLVSGAAQLLADAAGGYPYAIQLYGYHAWEAAETRPEIDVAAARRGMERATAELEQALYARRWAQASPREREYLAAVAELLDRGEPATGGAVAAHLGQTTPQLATCRAHLLAKGTLCATDGQLGFVIPGMTRYVLRQAAEVHRTARPGHRRRARRNARLAAPPVDRCQQRDGRRERAERRATDTTSGLERHHSGPSRKPRTILVRTCLQNHEIPTWRIRPVAQQWACGSSRKTRQVPSRNGGEVRAQGNPASHTGCLHGEHMFVRSIAAGGGALRPQRARLASGGYVRWVDSGLTSGRADTIVST